MGHQSLHPPNRSSTPSVVATDLLAALAQHPLRSALNPDGLSVELLLLLPQDALDVMSELLDHIFASGILPKRWRYSLILALLKEGKPHEDAQSH